MNGYIKLFRKLLNWEWYGDINVKVLFIHCLLKANYQEKKWRGVIVPRGSFITSIASLAEETGLTAQQTRTALDKLKITRNLTIKTTNKFSLVTVINWSVYQTDNTVPNQRVTSQQPATNHIQERKEIKNDKNILLPKSFLTSVIPGYCTNCVPMHSTEDPHNHIKK